MRLHRGATGAPVHAWWSLEPQAAAQLLGVTLAGLSGAQAARRLAGQKPDELPDGRPLTGLMVAWNQLRSPLLLLLIFAAAASALTGAWVDSAMVLAIVLASAGIGYWREFRAQSAAARLKARIVVRSTVWRDGGPMQVPLHEVVAGDIVLLSAGSLVPADALLIEATDLCVDESLLTGESFPVGKRPGAVAATAGLTQRHNCVFLGTSVRTGTGRCLVMAGRAASHFAGIARRLTLRPPETAFDRGLRQFGYLLASVMFIMVLAVFAANVLLGREPVETLLFAIALAVGLSPELLPAILNVNLARGAQAMARRGVLVRRLSAIENLGSMDVLCTDKTGTLTEGVIRLEGAYDAEAHPSMQVLLLAGCNAGLQTGMANPLDEAILGAHEPDLSQVEKLAEIPYDFVRKRLSVVVRTPAGIRLITKGAFEQVLQLCVRTADGVALDEARRNLLRRRFQSWSDQGTRVLAVATRDLEAHAHYGRDDEAQLDFAGFLTFLDRPKEGVADAIRSLGGMGVAVKLITGDNALVARHLAATVGLGTERVLTGRDLDELHDEALWRVAQSTDLFVEVDPNQKERIILSLKKTGHVVGFLGDGINDAPAMHAADAGLSVAQASDVAREAADFVLLERDLGVICAGIEAGRTTFANTLKYVLVTTSANLGNMVSMAVASLFLPFLPLLAGQVLLNNLLSDIPAAGLAEDRVDADWITRPRRWNMRFIGRFMVTFGLLSSLFDFLTFATLLWLFAAGVELFRTGWFVESLLTELVVALVLRTRGSMFRSRPGGLLVILTIATGALGLIIPHVPFAGLLGFTALPAAVSLALVAITVLYATVTEIAKRRFFHTRTGSSGPGHG